MGTEGNWGLWPELSVGKCKLWENGDSGLQYILWENGNCGESWELRENGDWKTVDCGKVFR